LLTISQEMIETGEKWLKWFKLIENDENWLKNK
jgi:hypothetical protein